MSDDIAALFKHGRAKKEWSLREAAKHLDTGFGHLCEIENGKHTNLTMTTLVRAQRVYGIRTAALWAAVLTTTDKGAA